MSSYPLLESLEGPDEIRHLTEEEKGRLASELRDLIIKTVALTGGHLAPNLGVIELTIALLATGHFPEDSLIFDVGHQAYAWKILTGRLPRFSSLRQKNGLSGFPKREESPYDSFNTGHSSTSISAALGLARAKRARGDHSKTMALIGDGALGGGMAFEALSDAGQSGENLLVILNDNQMCIDQAVGGMARHLENLRTSQRYIRLKTLWEVRLAKIPLLGNALIHLLARQKRRWRSWRRETGILFEQLGFRYYGPVDGHDLPDLERHLTAMRLVRGPVLLHVLTTKGKGYCYAEDEPQVFHGVSPFDSQNGQSNGQDGKKETYSAIFGQSLLELAKKDPLIVAVTAAMTQGTGLAPFQEALPDRLHDVGIAEQHALTMAAGMAVGGLKPYIAVYSTFMQRALDQLIHDICLQNLPVVMAIDRAGLVGGDGETHQGVYDIAMAQSLPNLTFLAPASGEDLRAMVHYGANHQGPLMIRYPNEEASKENSYQYPEDLDQVSLSDFSRLRPVLKGSDLTLVALGVTLKESRAACESLMAKHPHISIDLYSSVSILPFDYKSMLESIQHTGRLLLVEDGVEAGGFGSLVAARASRARPGILIDYAGVREPAGGQASRPELIQKEGLDREGLELRMMRLLGLEGTGGDPEL